MMSMSRCDSLLANWSPIKCMGAASVVFIHEHAFQASRQGYALQSAKAI